jgi:hypothetical protein
VTDEEPTPEPSRLWRDLLSYVAGVAIWTVIRVYLFHDAFWSSFAQGVVLMAILLYVMVRSRRGRERRP